MMSLPLTPWCRLNINWCPNRFGKILCQTSFHIDFVQTFGICICEKEKNELIESSDSTIKRWEQNPSSRLSCTDHVH